MAKAVVRYVEEQVVTTTKKADGVTLELSQAEAEVLRVLTGNVGSDGACRKLTSAIYYALGDAGVAASHVSGIKADPVVYFNEGNTKENG